MCCHLSTFGLNYSVLNKVQFFQLTKTSDQYEQYTFVVGLVTCNNCGIFIGDILIAYAHDILANKYYPLMNNFFYAKMK